MLRHELHLVTFAQSAEDLTYKDELSEIFQEIELIYLPKWRSVLNCVNNALSSTPFQVSYFQSAAMQTCINNMLSKHTYDAIHVQHLRMSPYLKDNTQTPRILDLPDAFSLYWQRRSEIKRNPALTIFEKEEQKRVLAYEAIINKYNMALACSVEDVNYLQQLHPAAKLRLLPNGVDTSTFAPRAHSYSHNNTLLFTGNMDYAPNIDAVQYFATEIFPLVLQKHPNTKFIIAGQRPVQKVLDLAKDNIIITGFVKDLAATYNDASVVVAPLRFGAGTQNKVLEAMSMGIPVVCSHIGFAGLGIQTGEGAYMETTVNTFADRVCQLLSSAEMRQNTGQKGIAVIRNNFDWDIIAQTLESYLMAIANKS